MLDVETYVPKLYLTNVHHTLIAQLIEIKLISRIEISAVSLRVILARG